MSSIQDLREHRAAKSEEMKVLASKANWNEAKDKPIYDAMLAEFDDLNQRIERINVMNAQTADRFTGSASFRSEC